MYYTLFVQIFVGTNFRVFSRRTSICAKLCEISLKLVPSFCSVVAGAQKFIRTKNFKLYIWKKAAQKSCFGQQFARKLVPNFDVLWKVRKNKSARKFLIFAQMKCVKIITNKVLYEGNLSILFTTLTYTHIL